MGLSTRELVQCLAAPVAGARPIMDIVEFGTLYMLRNHIHLDIKSEYILKKKRSANGVGFSEATI